MSIQLELKVTAGKPIYRGHDHYWSVIRDLGKNAHLLVSSSLLLFCLFSLLCIGQAGPS